MAKPILKWAGGKTQLLPIISQHYPKDLGIRIRKYIDPFFGGGAVFFNLYNSGLIDEAIIIDANPELVLLYKTIQRQPENVIDRLFEFQKKYFLLNEQDQKKFFYGMREKFNFEHKESYSTPNASRAAQIIFLNRTCFNGLYRVNRKQYFNVPHGASRRSPSGEVIPPKILDINNIYAVSKALQIAEILHEDFNHTETVATLNHFIYYDPPYRPLNKTSHFNSYSEVFNDFDQMRLADTFKKLDAIGIRQMLSNSDPLAASGDGFFDKLYEGFNIHRVKAKRRINVNPEKRGDIFELLITN